MVVQSHEKWHAKGSKVLKKTSYSYNSSNVSNQRIRHSRENFPIEHTRFVIVGAQPHIPRDGRVFLGKWMTKTMIMNHSSSALHATKQHCDSVKLMLYFFLWNLRDFTEGNKIYDTSQEKLSKTCNKLVSNTEWYARQSQDCLAPIGTIHE